MAEYEGGGGGGGGGAAQHPKVECHTSEEEESRSSEHGGDGGGKAAQQTQMIQVLSGGGGGDGGGVGTGTVEVARKPRGRPPGSKNKPKPPIIITRDSENAMRPLILEVAGGCDIGESVAHFARRRQIGVCVMSGNGIVSNVTLRQPSSPGAAATFHGRFQILSLSGTFLPSPSVSGGLTISLAGTQGQVVGGTVMGTLTAAGPVMIIAASFGNPSFHRLPLDEDENAIASASAGAGAAVGGQVQGNQAVPPSGLSAASSGHPPAASGGESCGGGMAIYTNPINCQMTPDVFAWAVSRPPY